MVKLRLMALILALAILAGCGTLANGRKWGEDARTDPGWGRVGNAAWNALLSPMTWVPAVGAGIMQIDHWDKKASRWAQRYHPVFGSRQNADDWSDYLLGGSGALYAATALATPSGDQAGDWVTNKVRGGLVGVAAVGLSESVVVATQAGVSRKRPDGSDDKSFPSGHATGAASLATLSARNLDALRLSRPVTIAADAGLAGLALGTAWARVEAGKHYPSDVLTGIALGHFVSALVNDAFLGLDSGKDLVPTAELSSKGFSVAVSGRF